MDTLLPSTHTGPLSTSWGLSVGRHMTLLDATTVRDSLDFSCRASLGWDSALYNALEFVVFLNRLEFMDYWSLGALTKRTANWNLRNLPGGIGTGCREQG